MNVVESPVPGVGEAPTQAAPGPPGVIPFVERNTPRSYLLLAVESYLTVRSIVIVSPGPVQLSPLTGVALTTVVMTSPAVHELRFGHVALGNGYGDGKGSAAAKAKSPKLAPIDISNIAPQRILLLPVIDGV
jgi:hypothetical protein